MESNRRVLSTATPSERRLADSAHRDRPQPAAKAASPPPNVGRLHGVQGSAMRRKRRGDPTAPQSRSISIRIGGETLKYFEQVELELGLQAMDVFRDGILMAMYAAERWVGRDDRVKLMAHRPDMSEPLDLLARGHLNCVERFARADISMPLSMQIDGVSDGHVRAGEPVGKKVPQLRESSSEAPHAIAH